MAHKGSARQRLLKAAAELFYSEGVGATGIDAITARAGVAKMSLYNNFSSKADLVQTYIEARLAEWQNLYHARLNATGNPRDRVLAVFDSYVDHAACSYEQGFRGCGLLNAAAELPIGDPGRTTVARQKEEAEQLFCEHLKGMNHIPLSQVPQLAEHLSFLLEGAMARAGLDGHAGRLHAARSLAAALLDQPPARHA